MLARLIAQAQRQNGSVAVLVAVCMVALLGVAALGTDVGMLYVERHRLSAIADAAALAGAQLLPQQPEEAQATAYQYLARNGLPDGQAQVSLSDSNRKLTVSIAHSIPTYFARIFAVEQMDVGSQASAGKASISGGTGAAPLGVAEADWQIGQEVKLKLSAEENVTPGNYQALALGKGGASTYEANLTYGYNGWIRVDDWISTETGNMVGPTIRAIRYRIDNDPTATVETVQRGSTRLVLVPVLENFNVNGKGEVHVVGLAVFFIKQVEEKGSDRAEITGTFLRMAVQGESSLTAPDFGAYTTKLVP